VVRAHIQNLQSIKDTVVEIDGLTVVTGPNNSGKTAIMRALRGLFINAPAGPLVRQGAAYLQVTLTFDDGTEIIWKKGWTKPHQKGGTVNEYYVNGVKLENVGRGVPDEVAALGVREVPASSDRLWPQIAEQFDGTLFLLNKSGSAVAEALSDVERVGKLTKALRLSEKDKRGVSNELKVRQKDVKSLQAEVETFKDLDEVSKTISGFDPVAVQKMYGELKDAFRLRGRFREATGTVKALEGFDASLVPTAESVAAIQKRRAGLLVVRDYRDRWEALGVTVRALADFNSDVVPDPAKVQKIKKLRGLVGSLSERLQAAKAERDLLADFAEATLPDPAKARKIATVRDTVVALRDSYRSALALVAELDEAEENARKESQEADAEVVSALGERGLCPTCHTVHEGGTHASS